MQEKEFAGKVGLVTGAASGIGRSTALAFARSGARVVVSDVDEQGSQETVRLIEAGGGEACFIRADVSNPADCAALVSETVRRYTRLDAAVNNAGIGGETNNTADYSIEGWQKVLAVNLSGVFYCMKYEIPELLKTRGAIVNMASILGQVGFIGAPAYVAAKHGVVGLTRNAALEYAARDIRINSVGPGFIHTPLLADLESNAETVKMLIDLHPAGRLGQPEEVAELVLWLSSARASFVTGAYIPIDGGYLAR